jgi:glutathione peroxidase
MVDINRRTLIGAASLLAAGAGPEPGDAYGFTMPSIDNDIVKLSQYRGRVLLVVNTASFCGFTPQYKSLEALYSELGPAGLTVLGVPSQDFNQEYGTNGQVKAFCKATFDVTFPMAGISHVTGDNALPFYQWVRTTQNGWQPTWNFCKVLISRDGRILGTFVSKDTPDGEKLRGAIATALKS